MIYPTNALYTMIPKNGCSTLRFSVAVANGVISSLDQVHWIHSNNGSFPATTESAARADYTFVVLRCPYARLVSAFMDKVVNMDWPSWELWNRTDRATHPHDVTFADFVRHIARLPISQLNIHWRPQRDFLLFERYDDYFDLARIDTAWPTISERAGLRIVDTRAVLGHHTKGREVALSDASSMPAIDLLIRKRAGEVPTPASLFDDETLELATKRYRDDVQLYDTHFGPSDLARALGAP